VLDAVNLSPDDLPQRPLALLTDQCREAKERCNPNTRRIVIDLEACLGDLAPLPEVTIATADYYDACSSLVEKTIEVMQPVMDQAGGVGEEAVAGIYVVGGASSLPVVSRVLRERFGRRVHRSPYPSAAIAMGLAIAVDEDAGFEISDRLSRYFGVFREGRGGQEVIFDPIFSRQDKVPRAGEASVAYRRVYRPAHNIGRFRFVECAHLDAGGVPHGDITAFKDIFFPFDATLRAPGRDLSALPVHRMSGEGPLIQEEYAITPHGIVQVTMTDLETGYQRAYPVGG
jgi:molecular chaperone DnaK (HSP70)